MCSSDMKVSFVCLIVAESKVALSRFLSCLVANQSVQCHELNKEEEGIISWYQMGPKTHEEPLVRLLQTSTH